MRQAQTVKAPAAVDQLIVEAALALIVEQGFAAMSMRALAKKVGVHAGSLYYHFPSKLDVLEEVLELFLLQRLQAWWLQKPKRAGLLKQLDAFIAFHVQRHIGHAREEYLLRLELRHLEKAQRSRVQEQDEHYIGELAEIIAAGAAQGLFQVPDVQVVTRSLLAMLSGAAELGGNGQAVSEVFVVQILTRMARRLLRVPNTLEV